jgi:N-acetylglucosamine-6-phosphate deacetylase
VITPDEEIENGVVLIDGGKIEAVGKEADVTIPDDVERIDAGGCFVTPGFIDLHCHGAMGSDFMDGSLNDFATVCDYHLAGGVTSLLATTASTDLERLLSTLALVREARTAKVSPCEILGTHIEGPYFAQEMRGCHLAKFVRDPEREEWEQILEYADVIGSMTIAPELPGALECIRAFRERGIVLSAGHTMATDIEMAAGIEAGVTHSTHMYCAMSTTTKDGPNKVPGTVEAILARDEITTEVIADGVHLNETLLGLTVRGKGVDQVCVVSDAMRGAGMPDGIYTFGPKDGQPATVQDGRSVMPDESGFASGCVTQNECVRTMHELVGLPVRDAVKMATLVPARIIGRDDRKGRLAPGMDADVLVLNGELRPRTIVAGGALVLSDH